MTKQINSTDKFIEFIFNTNKRSDKQRGELLKVIGTGHGYTSVGVIGRGGGYEQSNIQTD